MSRPLFERMLARTASLDAHDCVSLVTMTTLEPLDTSDLQDSPRSRCEQVLDFTPQEVFTVSQVTFAIACCLPDLRITRKPG